MIVAIGFAFLCVFAMFNQSCNRNDEPEASPENAAIFNSREINKFTDVETSFPFGNRFGIDMVLKVSDQRSEQMHRPPV